MFDSQPSSNPLPPSARHPLISGQLPAFMGYHRADGRVGTRNYWLVIPLFTAESQQLTLLKEALLTSLGYSGPNPYLNQLRALREQYRAGSYFEAPQPDYARTTPLPLFANIDGVRFLPNLPQQTQSAQLPGSFWQLLACYCTHPNVGGITVLSMDGTDTNRSVDTLRQHIHQLDPVISKAFVVADRFDNTTEFDWLSAATRRTFQAMATLNKQTRQPAPLSRLTVGVRWGEAGGFSANPAVGHYVDLVMGLGATVVMATPGPADKQPSPCGPAYSTPVPGLHRFSLPGNIVEVTTALIATGCTLHVSTNGSLPTGNPIAPVMELVARQGFANGLPDWIDMAFGDADLPGETLLQYSLKLASGQQLTQSETRGRHDFKVYQP